jgi:hypothetical protein
LKYVASQPQHDKRAKGMKIWRLLPIDLSDERWAASRHEGKIIIRAESAKRAREIASQAFGVATAKPGADTTNVAPWLQPDLVECHELTGGHFATGDCEAILYPPEYNTERLR